MSSYNCEMVLSVNMENTLEILYFPEASATNQKLPLKLSRKCYNVLCSGPNYHVNTKMD